MGDYNDDEKNETYGGGRQTEFAVAEEKTELVAPARILWCSEPCAVAHRWLLSRSNEKLSSGRLLRVKYTLPSVKQTVAPTVCFSEC
jgi:hypothetical protein